VRVVGAQRAVYHRYMEPLASRIRPRTLDEFVGQEHLTIVLMII